VANIRSIFSRLSWLALVVVAATVLAPLPAVTSATTGDVGYRDQSYAGTSEPTGTKRPESALWWNDGSWWANMFDTASKTFHIFRLSVPTQTWVDTGVRADDRTNTSADTLWDGTHLYIASHKKGSPASGKPSRLYRFSYNASSDTYSLDAGFPAQLNNFKSVTLTIAKDSTGKLWATWAGSSVIWVNRTLGNDQTWGTPFALPSPDANPVTSAEVSALVAFGGDKIGVMWSNHTTADDGMFFATHSDGAADTTWNATERAFTGAKTADDHINLKDLQTDPSGLVFAAVKTSYTKATDPLIMMLARSATGTWSRYPIARVQDCPNRPIVVIDGEHRVLHVFYTAPSPPNFGCNTDVRGGAIYEKTSPLDAISFTVGAGTPMIVDIASPYVHNVSSTKQNVSSATGIAILAVSRSTSYYWHQYLTIAP
jgi:hypothetical protein